VSGPGDWLRDQRRRAARLLNMGLAGVPAAPALPVRDPWPGDAVRGADLLRGELVLGGAAIPLRPGEAFAERGPAVLRAHAHGFVWLRDLRMLGTDNARLRARALVGEWMALARPDPLAWRPDVAGSRLAAWLGHYDFFAASADDAFRQKLMARVVADAQELARALPAEQLDGRAMTAVKGLVAAAVALPEPATLMARALKLLPQEIIRQVLPDGMQCERSPARHLGVLQDLCEIRALLQAAGATPPHMLSPAIERMSQALRMLRHGDGGLALFNGSREETPALLEQVLTQAGRTGRAPNDLPEGGFRRLQAGRSCLIIDCGLPAAPKLDRSAHAGTLSFELSVGRERLIVNCGAAPVADEAWRDACRATAAHSTLIVADTNSAELKPEGLGWRAGHVEVGPAMTPQPPYWLDTSHDGYRRPFGAVHHRRLYMSDSGEDIRGEDSIEAASPQPFQLRFHLHPGVSASLQQDGEAVLLRLPSGSGWRFRAEPANLAVEDSIYLGGAEPRRCQQIVITCRQDEPQLVKWGLEKFG
jgi:uncharacterized heparinase superfamily protein